ncbi:MAG TPA: hypothetical protein VJ205_00370, partial [Gammaproteobacteria bacterium]|nr:hypothetical protein [Gammaproteobacteria bacterium]
MPRFQFKTSPPENGIVTLTFQDLTTAHFLATTMYKWGIVNAQGTGKRYPILQNGQPIIRVSEEELKLITTFNEAPFAAPERAFTVFNPLIRNAAEHVRLDFMSRPYKGAIDPKLEKKDYDEFETIRFYQRPQLTVDESTEEAVFRTALESEADLAITILARKTKKQKPKEKRYEITIAETPLMNDPARGYELSTILLSTKDLADINDIDTLDVIKKWKAKRRTDIATDTRFIAIEYNNSCFLYGMDPKTKTYKIIEDPDDEIFDAIDHLLNISPAKSTLSTIPFDLENAKDVIKWGKCYAN